VEDVQAVVITAVDVAGIVAEAATAADGIETEDHKYQTSEVLKTSEVFYKRKKDNDIVLLFVSRMDRLIMQYESKILRFMILQKGDTYLRLAEAIDCCRTQDLLSIGLFNRIP
jgi:hypothetical protein